MPQCEKSAIISHLYPSNLVALFHKEDLGHERGVDANAFMPIINNIFP